MSDLRISELPLAENVADADVLVGNAGATTSRVKIDQSGGVPIFDGVVKAVVYDAGWPATRPNADTVIAIGGPTAPPWIGANDLRFTEFATAVLTNANLTGLTIIETSTGVWSGDAPARDPGVNPIVFVGESDPADATDGITTPANINAGDQWIDTGAA